MHITNSYIYDVEQVSEISGRLKILAFTLLRKAIYLSLLITAFSVHFVKKYYFVSQKYYY